MPHITPMRRIIAKKRRDSPLLTNSLLNKNDLSLPVSRVLSCTVIYLALPSPTSSSDINGISSDGPPYRRKPNLAAGGVYMARFVTNASVSSYLAFPSLPQIGNSRMSIQAKRQAICGGLFLLHYPGDHSRLTLSGTLSYAARTFLMARMPRDRITNSNLDIL